MLLCRLSLEFIFALVQRDNNADGCVDTHLFCFFTCSSTLLAVAKGGGPETPQPEGLGPLLPRRVACLVWMPQLFAVVAELCPTALTPAGDLWAACTAKRDDCITEKERKRNTKPLRGLVIAGRKAWVQ